jgi:hypothetical protein
VYCKPCNNEHARGNYWANRARGIEARREYYAANKDSPVYKARAAESLRAYRERNREAVSANARAWRAANPERVAAYVRSQTAVRRASVIRRKLGLARATPIWANVAAMQAVYDEARRLTEVTGIPHHVDHIAPLRGKTVSGLHCEANLRVITARENMRKGNRLADDIV